MKSLLILRHIEIENANAISGLTYGFPSVSNFLGFVHALSRKLTTQYGLSTNGVAIISHNHQVNAHRDSPFKEYYFSQTKNPLMKDGKSPPFASPEGKMSLKVTILIECDFLLEDIKEDRDFFESNVKNISAQLRIAGGFIKSIKKVEFKEIPQSEEKFQKFYKEEKRKLLPGFALIDRIDLLEVHYQKIQEFDKSTDLFESWLDFFTIKYQAEPILEEGQVLDENTKANWAFVSKPAGGWLVPINIGYKAISDLYEAGKVHRTRDNITPFRFVESAYSVGEWVSPHRIQNLKELFWYHEASPDKGWYLCKNNYISFNK